MIFLSQPLLFQWLESDDLLSTYEELSRSEYSWEELQARPLPPGVDPARIETYLSDSVFMVSDRPAASTFSRENYFRRSSR